MFPVDLTELDPDAFCFPGHKGLLGPTGTGAFYLKEGIEMDPLIFGGTGSRSDQEIQPDFLPDRFESGTLNIAGIAGLGKALDFISDTGIDKIRDHKRKIIAQLIGGIKQIGHFRIHGPGNIEDQIGIVSIDSHRISLTDLTRELDEREIAVRMGLHCAPAAHRTMQTFSQGGTVRISPGYFTTEEEIQETLNILKEIAEKY